MECIKRNKMPLRAMQKKKRNLPWQMCGISEIQRKNKRYPQKGKRRKKMDLNNYTKEELIAIIQKLESVNNKIFWQFIELNEKIKEYENSEKVKKVEKI